MASANPTIIWLTTNPVTTWLVRTIFSRVDPFVFRKTNGRYTAMGPPSMPMLTLTAVGRHSGKARSVHLACLEQGGDFLIVASAMGQERHPAWRYNLEANPEVEVQVAGRRFAAHAQLLDEESRAEIWPRVHDAIPQMKTYESRTDRKICVFRLRPV
jgi:deazaflavin-dependent oxidoreductase (nitroreductase family)